MSIKQTLSDHAGMTPAEATAYLRIKERGRNLWWYAALLSLGPSLIVFLLALLIGLQPTDKPIVQTAEVANSRLFYNAADPAWAGIILTFTVSLLIASSISLRGTRFQGRTHRTLTITDSEGKATHIDDVDTIDLRSQLTLFIACVLPIAHAFLTVLALLWWFTPARSSDYSLAEVNIRLGVCWFLLILGSVAATIMYQADTLDNLRRKGATAELASAIKTQHGGDMQAVLQAGERDQTAPQKISRWLIIAVVLGYAALVSVLYILTGRGWKYGTFWAVVFCVLGVLIAVMGILCALWIEFALGLRQGNLLLYAPRSPIGPIFRLAHIPGKQPSSLREALARHLFWFPGIMTGFLFAFTLSDSEWVAVVSIATALACSFILYLKLGAAMVRPYGGLLVFRRWVPGAARLTQANAQNTAAFLGEVG
ncbi:hypothetical protein [Corynebacterium sp. 21KM1197]|uniref:hypothetical protein n=1 Tax=Corynebacterium sp. 21KM1197 TaxID=2989734 RepID=UPI0029CA017F|nr:hypothetical protein [Corynebacterium sp. 21KM1197]WPF68142.1 hypothetical protein OLW90_08715 [Corynebacterium sp. 21KM1197]